MTIDVALMARAFAAYQKAVATVFLQAAPLTEQDISGDAVLGLILTLHPPSSLSATDVILGMQRAHCLVPREDRYFFNLRTPEIEPPGAALYRRIRAIFDPIGGADDAPPPPRDWVRDPPLPKGTDVQT